MQFHKKKSAEVVKVCSPTPHSLPGAMTVNGTNDDASDDARYDAGYDANQSVVFDEGHEALTLTLTLPQGVGLESS